MSPTNDSDSGLSIRAAHRDDLDAIVGLTAALRARLAHWSPVWWRPADEADAFHRMWLEHLLSNVDGCVRVVVDPDGGMVACAAVNQQPGQWFVDDLAVVDESVWPLVTGPLVGGIAERPALTCAARRDTARISALTAAGCELVSSYWIGPTSGTVADMLDPGPIDQRVAAAPRPPHTFGASPIDHTAADALAFSSDDGSVIGTPSIAAPPIFDPGGPVTVIDLIDGSDQDGLLTAARTMASARGDVLLCVVCGDSDDGLAAALGRAGFVATVDVLRWPTAS